MVLFHIEAEWSTAGMENGGAYVIKTITGTEMMQLLSAVSWDIEVQVYFFNVEGINVAVRKG